MKYLLLILIFLSTSSCEKDETLPDQAESVPVEVPKTSGKILTVESSHVRIYEMVMLHANEMFIKTIPGKLGDKSVELTRLDDSTAGVFIPNIPPGKYTLLSEMGDVDLTIVKGESRTEEEVFRDVDDAINYVQSSKGISEDEIAISQAFNDDVKTLFMSLTAEQKKEALAIYAANRSKIEALIASLEVETIAPANHQYIAKQMDAFPNTLKGPLVAEDFSSECEHLYQHNYLVQMDCKVREVNDQYLGLLKSLGHLALFSYFTVTAINLSPVTVGISTISGSVSAVMALYILAAEVRPYVHLLARNAKEFLTRKWVLVTDQKEALKQTFRSDDLFTIEDIFQQRAIVLSDRFTPNFISFSNLKARVDKQMVKLKAIFSPLPDYSDEQERVKSELIKWTVSEISNPNVKLAQISDNRIAFKSEKDESFTYRLSADYFGQKHSLIVEAKVINDINADYQLQIARDHHPDYDRIKEFDTYNEGDLINFQNFVNYNFRILYKGQPIISSVPYWNGVRISGTIMPLYIGNTPTSNKQMLIDEYEIKFLDVTNVRNVSLRFPVKLSNDAYDRVVGRTLNVYGYNVTESARHPHFPEGPIKLTFRSNGTLRVQYPVDNYGYESTWQFSRTTYRHWVDCGTYIHNEEVIGAVELGVTSYSLPSFVIIYKDGTYSANSHYLCYDSFIIK